MTKINFDNHARVRFDSLKEGTFFIFNNNLYFTVEKFDDDTWTNAVCITNDGAYAKSGNRNNFNDDIMVIPIKEIHIDYEI